MLNDSFINTYLTKFRDIYETSEVLEIRTFIVKLAKSVVLGIVPLTQRFESLGITSAYETSQKIIAFVQSSHVRRNNARNMLVIKRQML